MHVRRAALAALMLGVPRERCGRNGGTDDPADPPKFDAQTERFYVNRADIYNTRPCRPYSEPAWVTAFVDAASRPRWRASAEGTAGLQDREHARWSRRLWRRDAPCDRRRPRLELLAGQSYGWGGIDIVWSSADAHGSALHRGLDRPAPMPNLAKSWNGPKTQDPDGQADRGREMVDGDPFDVQDIEFYWNDVVMDENVTPLMGASPATYNNATFAWVMTIPSP